MLSFFTPHATLAQPISEVHPVSIEYPIPDITIPSVIITDSPTIGEVEAEIHRLAPIIGVDEKLTVALSQCEAGLKAPDRKLIDPYATGTQAVLGIDYGPLQVNSYWHEKEMRREGLDIKKWQDSLLYGMKMLKWNGTVHWEASRYCWEPKLTNPQFLQQFDAPEER